ncbi:MAG TPA: hypothetical protein VFJ02_03365 [Vicinamibacterales bacterium]|nr:hypothetical protein [Vicinamibacterales bacterium]
MPLRIGFDMDGVLADFGSAFREYGARLFGPVVPVNTHIGHRRLPGDQPETEEARQAAAEEEARANIEHARALRRREDKIWQVIESTPNFWATLKPIEEGTVRRIHELMLRHRWEVFFITQRPFTEGETVQRQTQRWLVEQGFDLPSVLVISGSRGAAAKAIRLDYHVDDNSQNCFDVIADSNARPILVIPPSHDAAIASARKLGIGVVHRTSEALDILEQATLAQTNPSLLQRIAAMVGWK